MGNVVSSLLMYALQAAWFCQRLIDQDYRQNHGSRSKPIMDIDETDLDVFLSKCRSYYLTKRKSRDETDEEFEERNATDGGSVQEGESLSCCLVYGDYACLDLGRGGFLVHHQTVLRDADLSGFLPDQENLEAFLASGGDRPAGSAKAERWKRKKSYYRKRFNPRRGPDRTASVTEARPRHVRLQAQLMQVETADAAEDLVPSGAEGTPSRDSSDDRLKGPATGADHRQWEAKVEGSGILETATTTTTGGLSPADKPNVAVPSATVDLQT